MNKWIDINIYTHVYTHMYALPNVEYGRKEMEGNSWNLDQCIGGWRLLMDWWTFLWIKLVQMNGCSVFFGGVDRWKVLCRKRLWTDGLGFPRPSLRVIFCTLELDQHYNPNQPVSNVVSEKDPTQLIHKSHNHTRSYFNPCLVLLLFLGPILDGQVESRETSPTKRLPLFQHQKSSGIIFNRFFHPICCARAHFLGKEIPKGMDWFQYARDSLNDSYGTPKKNLLCQWQS